MSRNINRSGWLAAVLFTCFAYPILSVADQNDTYRYILKTSSNDKVCDHMKGVYNRYFKRPFAASPDLADFDEGGSYALPLLPGVTRDPRLARAMIFSIQPSSPEFDAVKWREMRVNYPGEYSGGERAAMVANVDIDNDGSIETVIKFGFMVGYVHAAGGGTDALAIYSNGTIALDKQPLDFDVLYQGPDGHPLPIHIGGYTNGFPYQIVRIFNYGGVNYLSAYRQHWSNKWPPSYQPPDQEFIDVLQYHAGGDNLGKGHWSPLKIDTICRFRMTVIKQMELNQRR